MATTTTEAKSVQEQINELLTEAEQHEQAARESMGKKSDCFKRISDLCASEAGAEVVMNNGSQASASAPPPKRKPTGAATPTKGKPGPKPGAKRGGAAPAKAGTQRNYENEISLRQAIWDATDREPRSYKKLLTDYPADSAVGLKISEIKEVIEKEQKWVSGSENISPQIQNHVGDFVHEGKFARGDDRRYYVVDGAEIDGPPLGPNGKPLKSGPDGTFLTPEGKTFMTKDGKKPWKKRAKGEKEE